jgi:hypothetical protein
MNYGNWKLDKGHYSSIVSDQPTGIDDPANVEAYGGHLVCESVPEKMTPVLMAAPAMAAAIEAFERYFDPHAPAAEDDTEWEELQRLMKAAVAALKGDI